MKGIQNLRDADKDDDVIEMIEYASKSFKDTLLSFYDPILLDDYVVESWHTTSLQMLSKDGDLNELKNLRPIVLLSIFCFFFQTYF